MYKLAVFAAVLAFANAGLLSAPAVAYSSAPAVSSSYIHQAAAPIATYAHAAPVATYAHAAPVATYAHAAPVVSTYAHAAPVATYAHAAPVVSTYAHSPAIGSSHQSVVRSPLGNAAVSTYSKAVDTAFSSVRKFDTRVTNDALAYAHAPVVSTYAHAPVATYAAHAPVTTYAHAPVATYAAHAPVVAAKTAVAYSPAAVVSHATFSGLGASYAW